MFCSSCGSSVDKNHKFCPKCGTKVASFSVAQKGESSENRKPTKTPVSFEKYRGEKEKERATHFRPTKGKRKRPAEDLEESVRVNIGIMLYDESTAELKRQRSKGLNVNIKKNTTKDMLLKVSIDKHVAHSKDLINPRHQYHVLYPDGTIVDKLKESDEEFVLCKYKSECGKPYDRISFFLCPIIDYARATLQSSLKSDSDISLSSDSELNKEGREVKNSNIKNDISSGGKKHGGSGSGIQATISSYVVNVDGDQSSVAAGSNPAVSIVCADVHPSPLSSVPSSSKSFPYNVVGADFNRGSANPGSSKSTAVDIVSDDISQLPCSVSGGAASSMTTIHDAQHSSFTTLMEMFPQLDETKIREALVQGNFDIELAVAHVLSCSPSNTPQQVYAALDFCNVVDKNEEQEEHTSTVTDLEYVKRSGLEEVSGLEESSDDTPFSTIIKDFSANKFDPEHPLRIKIRRSHVWQDAVFKLKRCCEGDLNKLIKVQFIGEPAVDQGGPRNEFFSLLHREIASSSLFVGEPESKCFNHNIIALEQKEYLLYGQLCALGILQDSPSPCFFSPSVTDYIVYGKLSKVSTCVKDVPNAKAKKKLEGLQGICDPDKFKQVASFDCSLRFKAGYTKPIVTIEDKDDLIRCISLHYLLLSGLVELEQFIDGLKLNGVLDLLRKHPKKARHLFMQSCENQVTSEKLDELFNCVFSPEGSNRRAPEEAVALNLFLYLEAVEANEAKSNLLDLATGEETEITLSLSDVLQFITGSSTVPATGFNEKPSIVFQHGDPHRKLHANTCSNTLTLPVNSTLMEFESFKNEFTSCLVMSPGFGTI